ncbi:hypothetical protein O4J56_14720 [Nocardiopsis sp. RSe5-2]|uniref:SMI1/KNR4 family protein n=1 Tax=Nocardiopsis endophytica TaxID=3018445 RepID=A0ABT4U5Z2_9ACTN|nr:hypothetical protein [Nocardiopsis endophytica]MDA2811894.1 hypothetical protein [Nocardiopsis endophytica]
MATSHSHPPIPELDLLAAFDATRTGYLALGFEMGRYTRRGLEPAPGFDGRLITFAQANGSGSLYAVWLRDRGADPAAQPVVALGDEGGVRLVARDLRAFLTFLAALPTNCEPHIDTEGVFVRELIDPDDEEDEDDEGAALADNAAFTEWLDRTFGLAPADDWRAVVDAAEEEFGDEWAAWAHAFGPGSVWSPVRDLNRLYEADDGFAARHASGLWLLETYGDPDYADAPGLTTAMEPFATNGDDTVFALWRLDEQAGEQAGGRTGAADRPVVAAGMDGGVHVVARNAREFLGLVAGLEDTEIRCDRAGAALRPRDRAGQADAFRSWAEENLGVRPAADPAAVITAAHAELGGRLPR